jgi:hypothetical protein
VAVCSSYPTASLRKATIHACVRSKTQPQCRPAVSDDFHPQSATCSCPSGSPIRTVGSVEALKARLFGRIRPDDPAPMAGSEQPWETQCIRFRPVEQVAADLHMACLSRQRSNERWVCGKADIEQFGIAVFNGACKRALRVMSEIGTG